MLGTRPELGTMFVLGMRSVLECDPTCTALDNRTAQLNALHSTASFRDLFCALQRPKKHGRTLREKGRTAYRVRLHRASKKAH